MGTLPERTYRVGRFKLTVWTTSGDDGRQRDSLSLSKSFQREKDGPWEEQTIYVFPGDLGTIKALLTAYETDRLVKREAPQNQAEEQDRNSRQNRRRR